MSKKASNTTNTNKPTVTETVQATVESTTAEATAIEVAEIEVTEEEKTELVEDTEIEAVESTKTKTKNGEWKAFPIREVSDVDVQQFMIKVITEAAQADQVKPVEDWENKINHSMVVTVRANLMHVEDEQQELDAVLNVAKSIRLVEA